MKKFPFHKQHDEMDCGPSCLKMIASFYGKNYPISQLREFCHASREGSNLYNISEAAETIGFKTIGVRVSLHQLRKEILLPCIAHWKQKHFVVIYKTTAKKIVVADPSFGLVTYSQIEFCQAWATNNTQGVLLLLEPTPAFYSSETQGHNIVGSKEKYGFGYLFKYFFRYKKFMYQIILGLLVGSAFQAVLPLLTQSIIDIGIQQRNIHFIYLVLIAQLMLFFGKTMVEAIRTWLLMHIASRVNIALVTGFFIKLMKLPISFFDVKMTGDIMQRINDQHRIEAFLTSSSLNVLFSMLNILVFAAIMAFYNIYLLGVFMLGSVLYVSWIVFFQKRRAQIDFKRFSQLGSNQSKVIELINGMQEIKLHNAEKQKRWDWEHSQIGIFKTNLKSLSIEQTQQIGSAVINELKNILITILAAKLVIDGNITLGMMLSISYIIAQLNSPIMQLVGFLQHYQDAKLSIQRLSDTLNLQNEDEGKSFVNVNPSTNQPLILQNVSFHYSGLNTNLVINNLSIQIPENKITAIVGASGSGKTTLLKLLLKIYAPTSGKIKLSDTDMERILANRWRKLCGVVMQEGYIFSDTISNNVAIGEEKVDYDKLQHALSVANIKEFVEELPMSYNTKIGMEGMGLSTGQKQRILIARAVYKNPGYLFFDEATSALDANNEKIIMDNLNQFFNGKTVVIIAHRLSTVKNAHQIIVLEKGSTIEVGTHTNLVKQKGSYYNLVKNQLELGN